MEKIFNKFLLKKKIEYLNSEGNFILFKLKRKKLYLKNLLKKIKIVEKSILNILKVIQE